MMSRIKRKNRTDIIFKSSGGMNDLFDNQFKSFLRINDEEYDYICEHATDEELDAFTIFELTFSQKRNIIIFLEKLLNEYEKTKFKID